MAFRDKYKERIKEPIKLIVKNISKPNIIKTIQRWIKDGAAA